MVDRLLQVFETVGCATCVAHRIKAQTNDKWNIAPASGICSRAATALIAERFSSSCFSNSCFTEFAFTFVVHVARRGSTIWSKSAPQNTSQHFVDSWPVNIYSTISKCIHSMLIHAIQLRSWQNLQKQKPTAHSVNHSTNSMTDLNAGQ